MEMSHSLTQLYYKATIIKTVWYWEKQQQQQQIYGPIEQTESPEINSHVFGQLIFNKEAINIYQRKEGLVIKWCWKNWKVMCKKMNLDCYMTLLFYTKSSKKWIKYINILYFSDYKMHQTIRCTQVLEDKNRKKIFESKNVVKYLITSFKAEILYGRFSRRLRYAIVSF